VLLLQARVARRSGSWDDAQALLDRYWQRYGDDDRLVLERLLLRATRGEIHSVAPMLAARIALGGPDARLSREALVVGLLYRYRWAEAEYVLAGWLVNSPDDPLAILLQGRFYEHRQRTSEAMLNYRRVLELDPEHDEARLRLAVQLLEVRQGEEALAHLEYLRHRLPDNPAVHVHRATALALQGRTAEAQVALEQCLRENPEFPQALAELGRIALTAGDDRSAEDYLGRASRRDPGNMVVRSQYMRALTNTGKHELAAQEQKKLDTLQADFERINQIISGPFQSNPNDPALHHEIAIVALRAGLAAEAMRWFQSALEVNPDYLPTHQILVVVYRETGNPVMASKHRAIARRLEAQAK
jgi:tetratricopeptide (TPR) repeat protein